MSILEYPSHHDLATKTEVDPQIRTVNETLSALQLDSGHQDDSIVPTEDSVARLRKINDTQAKTRNLAPEILSLIFEFACPPIDFDKRFEDWYPGYTTFNPHDTFHFILAAVCDEWRQIVLTTPQLWTTIMLRPNRLGCSIKNATSLLNLYFERARAFPISVELDFQGETREWHFLRPEPIQVDRGYLARLEPLRKAVFVDKASRIQHLSLVQAPAPWLRLFNEKFSQCTSVAVFDPMELIERTNDGDAEEKEERGEKEGEGDSDRGSEVDREGESEGELRGEGGGVEGQSDESDEDTDNDHDESNEDDNFGTVLELSKLSRLNRLDLVFVNLDRLLLPPNAKAILRRKSISLGPGFYRLVLLEALESLINSFIQSCRSRIDEEVGEVA